ncbi:Rhodanese-like protein [Aspergillus sclerotiicarbonarius CBS 121057]|uniref:Rhodanese-like protein n=1 Tax=Aspergillus sclerotiicarbonarius (strain CBS 121057 / IBT 28362) TaxID=1448318 RepID=A0A319E5Y9_ASPSB|nr:Rhodanese-like protein [Aspergillus sclerotiicarbonarius CBS 121057]
MPPKSITARSVRQHWTNHQEIALLDVREEGPYAACHPLFAINVPVSEIETKVPGLVPRLSAPIVVYDNGEGYAARAAIRITALGYQDVSILADGLAGYARVGEVYRDVNTPSKAFGELVESIAHTPSLSAREVKDLIDGSGEQEVVVLDARRFEEYHTMGIPRGRSCPGGELLYRVFEAARDPETLVVVNCAGRTRSIIGTQTLVNAGIPNPIRALRNGTIGWMLDGFEVDMQKTEKVPQPSVTAVQRVRQHADSWAKYQLLAESADRTLYLLDVRDPEEYARGHPAGFATDEWMGVRGARIVLYDTDGVRAPMTASWLLQLGWEAYVASAAENLSIPQGPSCTVSPSGAITVEGLQALTGATVVDLARSPAYRRGHIPGAWFASGPDLARDLNQVNGDGPFVLTSPDGAVAAMNVADARQSVTRPVFYLAGGTTAWVTARNPLETEARWLSEPIDVYQQT